MGARNSSSGRGIKMKIGKLISVSLLSLLMVMLASCGKASFVSQDFSYPSYIRPHEQGWKFRAHIKISQNGDWTKKNEKTVEVLFVNDSGKTVMAERFRLNSGAVRAVATWNEANVLSIQFLEEGNPYAHDDYNSEILKRGPVVLKTQVYDPVKAFN